MKRLPDPTFDQRLADWLEDDPSLAPNEVLGTVLAAFPSIEQRRRSRAPWRYPLMNRYLLPVAAALIVAIGAIYLVFRPVSNVGPATTPTASAPSIEGTWDVSYTRQEMLAAGIVDEGEDNDGNYGHFRLTFQAGWYAMTQLSPIRSGGGTTTYTVDGAVAHLFSPQDNVTFDMPYTVTATTLTFGRGGPVGFRVKPWTRVATEVITATPEPAAIAAYRQARNAVCAELFQASLLPEADPVTNPAAAIAAIQSLIARGNDEVSRLSALTAPPSLEAEHQASIQAVRDTVLAFQQMIDLINQGKGDQVAAVDQSTAALSEAIQQFEQKYGLAGCP